MGNYLNWDAITNDINWSRENQTSWEVIQNLQKRIIQELINIPLEILPSLKILLINSPDKNEFKIQIFRFKNPETEIDLISQVPPEVLNEIIQKIITTKKDVIGVLQMEDINFRVLPANELPENIHNKLLKDSTLSSEDIDQLKTVVDKREGVVFQYQTDKNEFYQTVYEYITGDSPFDRVFNTLKLSGEVISENALNSLFLPKFKLEN